jgi:hypothetical protein
MQKLSPQTKSFIILIVIALVGTYVCLLLGAKFKDRQSANTSAPKGDYTQIVYPQKAVAAEQKEPAVDTSDWKTYTEPKLGLSFKYKPTWQVKPTIKQGEYYVIEVDPGKKYYNIKTFVSSKDFFAMDSLPLKQVTIAGKTAQDVSDMLYGIQSGNYYYTFDLGFSVNLKPEFNALVRSASFTQ